MDVLEFEHYGAMGFTLMCQTWLAGKFPNQVGGF